MEHVDELDVHSRWRVQNVCNAFTFLSVRVRVCVCAALLYHIHSSSPKRGASFSLTFSIRPPEESYDSWVSPVFLGTITHIKDGETNKQTIIPTAGAAFPLSNRRCKTNQMRQSKWEETVPVDGEDAESRHWPRWENCLQANDAACIIIRCEQHQKGKIQLNVD